MKPEDVVIINPCFRVQTDLSIADPDALAQDLADGLNDWQFDNNTPVEVRLYDIEGTKPVYPMAVAKVNAGTVPGEISQPSEIAVCLSFFADHPEPRRRGRLYVPFFLVGGKGDLDWKVNNGFQLKIAELVPLFAGLGGLNVDWIVWSDRDKAAHKVTDWWIDDQWDTVRSRGYRASSRMVGTTGG